MFSKSNGLMIERFLEWPVTFSSESSKDDQDQGVGGPSLKRESRDEIAKKNSILKISKAEFGLIKV